MPPRGGRLPHVWSCGRDLTCSVSPLAGGWKRYREERGKRGRGRGEKVKSETGEKWNDNCSPQQTYIHTPSLTLSPTDLHTPSLTLSPTDLQPAADDCIIHTKGLWNVEVFENLGTNIIQWAQPLRLLTHPLQVDDVIVPPDDIIMEEWCNNYFILGGLTGRLPQFWLPMQIGDPSECTQPPNDLRATNCLVCYIRRDQTFEFLFCHHPTVPHMDTRHY